MFDNRLKQLREERGLNMKQTAQKLEIPYTTYVGYEKNEREPNSEVLLLLADFFNCSIDYLLGRTDERVDEKTLERVLDTDDDLLKQYGNIYEAKKAQKLRDENATIEQLFADTVTRREIEHITKYRTLDGYGKRAVDSVLEIEFERCESVKKQPTIMIRYSRLPASAGAGVFLDDENIELRSFPDTPEARQADIVIPVDGRSMEPMFYDGDLLLVKQQEEIEPGQIGIFIKEGKGYVKKLAEDRLISINPEYEDIYPGEGEEVVCKGRVIGKV